MSIVLDIGRNLLCLTHVWPQWICSPACTELEVVVCDWAAKLLGLDKAFWNESQTGGGVIQVLSFKMYSVVVFDLIFPPVFKTTASDSVLVATVAARSRYTACIQMQI